MKMSLPILTLLLIFILSSCSKNAPITVQMNDTNISLPKIDSIPFPLKVGTWWKYKRADTTGYNIYAYPTNVYLKITVDSSIEIITVVGKTSLTDSVEAALLQVKNLTSGKTDTSYAFYYLSNFIVSENRPTDISSYAVNYYLKKNDMRFRLPLREGAYRIAPSDTIYLKKDTTATVLNRKFPPSIFTFERLYDFQGANSFQYGSDSFWGNNIGFLYWRASFKSHSHYGYHTDTWYVRRIMDYYIAP